MIPFAPYAPDLGPFSATTSDAVSNVLPTANGYSPLPKLADYSNALPGECRGSFYGRSSTGTFTIYAATATGLYKLNTTTLDWDDISARTYSIPSGDMWGFTQFGTKVIATSSNEPPQVVDVDAGGNFADLGGSPPQAKYCWVAGDYLVLGYVDGYPTRVQWSGLNDIAHWTVGEKGSDYQDLPDGGEVHGGMESVGGARIIQRNAKRQMRFAPGSGYTFQITVIDADRGAVSPASIVPLGGNDYVYLAEDGFYRGDAHQAIGAERVNRHFFEDVDLSLIEEVQGAADPYNKVVWWLYRDGSQNYKMIGYDWQLDQWTKSDFAPTILVSAVTPGYSIDGLSAFGNIDTIPYSLDSRVFKGGRPTFGAFTADNKLAFFSGTNAQATLETTSVQPIAGRRAFCNGFRFIGDADEVTGYHAVADYHGKARVWNAGAEENTRSGIIPCRGDGRLHRFRAVIAEGDDWNVAHGVEPNFVGSGNA